MTKVSKCASYVLKNSTRRRTSTGVVERIEESTEVKCGGAAVKGAKTSLGVNLLSMRVKRTKTKTMKLERGVLRASISST